ncbi:transposase [Salinarchaeum sp. IM2453]|uniref:zinc ribbon domain-containing protein n=1 Tax=Salinarchaeum sp. IM2453 TaxID=2862870 RepID=UPI001C8285A0|nr:transposase [Salinarchaeum sp. IM2453]
MVARARFCRRIQPVLEDGCGISVEEASEAGTSSQCPRCAEKRHVSRNGDVFQCDSCSC